MGVELLSKIQICRIFWVENGPQILYHVHGRVFIVEMVSPNLGSIRKLLGNFLMDTLFSQIWTICELPILNLSSRVYVFEHSPGTFKYVQGRMTLYQFETFL